MNILNICLAGPYSDGWNYQDNLLTKYQKLNGNNVTILTSRWIWNNAGVLTLTNKENYTNEDGVRVIRVPMKGVENFNKKIKRYKTIEQHIEEVNPDVIFVHGCQFIDIKKVAQYAKKHKVKIFVDNHADFSNSAKNWLSKKILHGIIWKKCAKIIEPFTAKFFGVLPARVDFLINVYKIPKNKVELLVMGVDDELAEIAKKESKEKIRKKYGIKNTDFLIISGGKIDPAKSQVLTLINAIRSIKDANVKLLLFGSIDENMKKQVLEKCDNKKIKYIGWLNTLDMYKLIHSSNLAVYPGRHSVIWEQTVGLGLPMIAKYWDGTTHIDIGGNVKYIYDDTVEEMKKAIEGVLNIRTYRAMTASANSKRRKMFSYRKIAQQSIHI